MAAQSLTPRAYTIPPLITSKYASWSIKIEMLLICSKLWSVVDGLEVALVASNQVGLSTWKIKDAKARLDVLLHCGKNQLLALKPLPTSKQV